MKFRDGEVVRDGRIPGHFGFSIDDVIGVLVNIARGAKASGPGWSVPVFLGNEPTAQWTYLNLEVIVTWEEYARSATAPLSFAELGFRIEGSPIRGADQLWLFRDALYVVQRPPLPSESDECERLTERARIW